MHALGDGTDAINAQVDRLEQRVGVFGFASLDDKQHETREERCLFYPLCSCLNKCERVRECGIRYTRRMSAMQHSMLNDKSMVDIRIADFPTFHIHLISPIQRHLRTEIIVQQGAVQRNLHTRLLDAAFRSSTSSNSSSPESLSSSGGSDSFAATASLSPSCMSTSSPSTAAATIVFVLPFALNVDLGALISALERREAGLEELATLVASGGDGGVEVAGLKLRDGASRVGKKGKAKS